MKNDLDLSFGLDYIVRLKMRITFWNITNKKTTSVITIVLFSIGVGSGLLILYDHLVNTHFIPKSEAIDVFWDDFNCTGKWQGQKSTTTVELIHIRHNRGYYVDERTMQDMALAFENTKNPFIENQYLWFVHGDCKIGNLTEIRSDARYIDATTGKLQF